MARCVVVPLPAEPKLSLPGSALALSISSFSVLSPVLGCTTTMLGMSPTTVMGAKALSVSNGILA